MYCTNNVATYEKEDDSTEEHQAFDRGLIEGVVHRVRMLVVAVLTDPRLGQRRESRIVLRRTAVTDQLELRMILSI